MKLSLLTKTENCSPRGAVLDLVREEVQQADKQISKAHDYVDFWKVGKLNHNKAVEQSALGPKFRAAATALLEHLLHQGRPAQGKLKKRNGLV